MKKTLFTMATVAMCAGMLVSCGSKQAENDTTGVEEEVVGEVIDMPSESSAASGTEIAAAEVEAVVPETASDISAK